MNNQTPREILNKFYKENNLGQEGGLNSSYVRIEISSKFYFYFPNFKARRKAVIKHDIHHLLTGYETTISGESEISAWEIGSGCKSYWAVFLIDTGGVMLGFLFNFRNILKAFSRGRRTKNLYHDIYTTEQALDMNINELRKSLSLDKYTKNTRPTIIDLALFLFFAFLGTIYSFLSLIFLPFMILYTLFIDMKIKSKK